MTNIRYAADEGRGPQYIGFHATVEPACHEVEPSLGSMFRFDEVTHFVTANFLPDDQS